MKSVTPPTPPISTDPTTAPVAPASAAAAAPPTFGARVRRGLLVQVLGRGGEQGIRLASNLVLARLLAPEEFGLLGMAATGLALADALAFVGTDQAVLAEPKGRRPRFLATAWFIALVRGLILGIVLLVLAAPIASWYGRPDATGLFLLIALQPLLIALAHPGAFVALRHLSFGRWTTARLAAVVLGTGATVALALLLRDARALVIGQLATTLLSSAASHLVTPRRLRVPPRPHRRHLGRLLRFSAQSAGTPLFIMGVVQLPVVLIGPALGPAALGVYLMLRRLCDAGRQLAVEAVGLVLIPAAARVAGDPILFRRTWSRALRPTGLIALGSSGLLAWLGGDVPATLLGSTFRGPRGLFSALAITGGLSTILGVGGAFFWGLARPALDRTVQLVRVVVLGVTATVLLGPLGVTGVALATVASTAAALFTTALLARRHADIPLRITATALAPGGMLGAGVWITGGLIDVTLHPAPSIRLLIGGLAAAVLTAVGLWPRVGRSLCPSKPGISLGRPFGASA